MRASLLSKKRGQLGLNQVPGAVMIIVFAILIGAVGLIVLSTFKATAGGSAAVNDTLDKGVDTIANIFSLMPLAGTILVLAVIIGLLVLAFFFFRGRGGGVGM